MEPGTNPEGCWEGLFQRPGSLEAISALMGKPLGISEEAGVVGLGMARSDFKPSVDQRQFRREGQLQRTDVAVVGS